MLAATPFLSIVTPTFNRRAIVERSIESSLRWMGERPNMELVVVDDGSSDGTPDFVRTRYAEEMAARRLRLEALPHNVGVTGAKNFGAAVAQGEWLVFLDSDDLLIESAAADMLTCLRDGHRHPVHFFRCRDRATGMLIGASECDAVEVGAKRYLTDWRWAECLPVVRRDAQRRYPYPAELRGHEGVSYARMMKHMGDGIVQPIVARTYDASGEDRLSTRRALLRRGRLLAKGYTYLVREFPRELGVRGIGQLLARIAYYRLMWMLVAVAGWRPTAGGER